MHRAEHLACGAGQGLLFDGEAGWGSPFTRGAGQPFSPWGGAGHASLMTLDRKDDFYRATRPVLHFLVFLNKS